jgi:antitoxin PrlF
MDVSAKVSSKGQVTVPRSVREALALRSGDRVSFRIQGHRAVLARTPDLLELAGSIDVPVEKRGTEWSEILRQTRAVRAATRR